MMLGFNQELWVVERTMTGLDDKKPPSVSLHVAKTMSKREAIRWAKDLNRHQSWHWPVFSQYEARPATQSDVEYISQRIDQS
jgi:hypothetical protein